MLLANKESERITGSKPLSVASGMHEVQDSSQRIVEIYETRPWVQNFEEMLYKDEIKR